MVSFCGREERRTCILLVRRDFRVRREVEEGGEAARKSGRMRKVSGKSMSETK